MGVERVSDVDDPRLADYRDLKDGARRRRDGTFIAESRQVVRRLLGGSRFPARSGLAAEAAAEDLRDVLTDGLPVYVAPEATLPRVGGFNIHRGCLAVGERGAELGVDGPLDARLLLVPERAGPRARGPAPRLRGGGPERRGARRRRPGGRDPHGGPRAVAERRHRIGDRAASPRTLRRKHRPALDDCRAIVE